MEIDMDISEPTQESLRHIALEPCKLIILYMLDIAADDLNTARIGDFVLGEDYANYTTLQTAINELMEGGFILGDVRENRTFLTITDQGKAGVGYFKNRLHEDTKANIKAYLNSIAVELREEASVSARHKKMPSGGYLAELSIKEGQKELFKLSLLAPAEDVAEDICRNWQDKYTHIYQYLMNELL